VAKGRRLRQAGASEPPIKALVPLTACMAAERQAVREGMGQALFNGVGFWMKRCLRGGGKFVEAYVNVQRDNNESFEQMILQV